MQSNYINWWNEEVTNHYKTMKLAVSCVFSLGMCMTIIGMFLIPKSDSQEFIFPKFLVFMFLGVLFLSFLWFIDGKSKNLSILTGLLLIEMMNIFFCSASRKEMQAHRMVLCINSTILTLFFQIGFVKHLFIVFLFILKHIFIWYTYDILFGTTESQYPFTYTWHIGLCLYVLIGEYYKRRNSFERFDAKNKLEHTQKNLKAILDYFPAGVVVFDKHLEIKYNNPKILEYLQCNETDLITVLEKTSYRCDRRNYLGQNNDFFLMKDLKTHMNEETGKESSLGTTESSERIYEWKIKKLWEDEHRILLTCFDITKSVCLEQVSAENKTKTSIIRSFSHELRTPITAILHYLGFLKQNIEDEKNLGYLESAMVASKQLFSQINDIIDLSNILSKNFKVIKQKFDFKAWALEHLEMFKKTTKNIEFKIVIDSLMPSEIYTDPNRLKQILYNFIDNSFKFTQKGSIWIIFKMSHNSQLKVIVKDTGIGIPQERKIQLINFFSNSEKKHLSGLGLYINKLILEYLGCERVQVKSDLGEGTEFLFKIDIFESHFVDESANFQDFTLEEDTKVQRIRSFETKNRVRLICDILVVDDNEINRKILISALKDLNVGILEACNGLEALEMIKLMNRKDFMIKVVIMDCNMPIMDGWEASKSIKVLANDGKILKSPAIIAYTAYSSEEDINLCYECGMVTYLIKPSTPTTILQTIKYYLLI